MVPVAVTITMNKGDIVNSLYESLLVDHTRTQETPGSRVTELRMKCGSSRMGHLRASVRHISSR